MTTRILPMLALITTSILWSSAFVLIKPLVAVISPGMLALLRYGIAAIVIFICYLALPNKSKCPWQVKAMSFVIGFIGIGLYNLTLNQAEITITAATTAFIISGVGPCVAVLLSVLCLGERPNLIAYFGMGLCVIGLAFMTAHHWGFGSVWGLLFAAIAAACGGSFSVLQKPLLACIKPFELMTFAILGGACFVLPFQMGQLHQALTLSLTSWLTIIYLAICPAIVAYSLWSYGIQKVAISRAVGVLYLIPVFTALFSWLLNHAAVPVYDWLGGGIIMIGALFINNRSAQRKTHEMDGSQPATSSTA